MTEVMTLKRAQRKQAKLKLGMSAPSGGGKTIGSLLIAYGLMKKKYPSLKDDELWSKIAIIDSENGSGELYVGAVIDNIKIGEYNAVTLKPPFEADKYTSAIEMCYEAGMEVAIIDSTTHLWSGAGGLLEQQGNIAKRTGNSYTAWRDVTPQHNRFIDTMLQTDMHIIATMRSKTDYVQEKDPNTGKTTVRKVGLNPIQKDGMEFEFTVFLEIDAEHNAFGSKDRTGVVDQKYFKITPKTGMELMDWLESATDAKDVVVAKSEVTSHEAKAADALSDLQKKVADKAISLNVRENPELIKLIKGYESSLNTNKIKDVAKLKELLDEIELLEVAQKTATQQNTETKVEQKENK
jgi:hypothetical protein